MMAAHGPLTVAAVLVAGGDGARLSAGVPKAFVVVAGQTLLEHAAHRFLTHPAVRDVVVVAPPAHVARAEALTVAAVLPGGSTRQQSVAAGLAGLADDVDFVLVHDVARAFVPVEVLDRVLAAAAAGHEAVVPAIGVSDTIRRVDPASGELAGTLDRASLVAIQTPQGFARSLLEQAHAQPQAVAAPATDDAALVEALGVHVIAVEGSERAHKITYPQDLALAEWLATR